MADVDMQDAAKTSKGEPSDAASGKKPRFEVKKVDIFKKKSPLLRRILTQ
jgi:hypothetical protein